MIKVSAVRKHDVETVSKPPVCMLRMLIPSEDAL
jgi:hypothetical protein